MAMGANNPCVFPIALIAESRFWSHSVQTCISRTNLLNQIYKMPGQEPICSMDTNVLMLTPKMTFPLFNSTLGW